MRDAADEDLPSGVRHLLLVLATYADADGRCHPSLETLGSRMGTTRNTARRRVRSAVELGWLVLDHQGRWNGDSSHYRLTPKGVHREPHAADRKGVHQRPERGPSATGKGSMVDPEGSKNLPERDGAPSQEEARASRERQIATARRVLEESEFPPARRAAERQLRELGVEAVAP